MLFNPFSQRKIYLDYAAGSEPNPSAIHNPGVLERHKLEASRKAAAKVLAVQANEIVFTSGGTEANNLAILGVFRAARSKVPPGAAGHGGNAPGNTLLRTAHPHIITSNIEHASVLEAVNQAEREGAEVSYLKVKENGVVDISNLESLIKPETVLVSLMHANNETGTIQPVRDVGLLLKKYPNLYYHVDAAQTAGYKSIEPHAFFADLLTISGHKVYGPKGTGLLYVRNATNIEPLFFGGGQERGLRPGTENVDGQVKFAEAFLEVQKNRNRESKRLEELRQYFLKELSIQGGLVYTYNGSKNHQLPNIVNVSFTNITSDRMVLELDAKGIAVSAGSACHAGQSEYSQVIANMKGEQLAKGAVRFSFGRGTTKKDIKIVVKAISAILNHKD